MPVQVKRTEFLEAHESFCETLENAQKEIEMQNAALQQKLANPEDLLVKYQVIFYFDIYIKQDHNISWTCTQTRVPKLWVVTHFWVAKL